MERDFMGLNSKYSVFVVKEEVVELGYKDSGLARSSGLAWPLSTMVSGLPHFMSLKHEQDEKPSKNFGGSTAKQKFIGGNPLTALHFVHPSTASAAGTTEQWINSKASGVAAAQLTIFYAGTVNVVDGESPEKAQAIMFLAGSGCVGPSKVYVEAAASKVACSGLPSPMSDGCTNINHAVKTIGCEVELRLGWQFLTRYDNPTRIRVEHFQVVTRLDWVRVDKIYIISPPQPDTNSPDTHELPPLPQAQRMVSVAATAMISSAVPQARKASLARFLEKRKERVMNALAPYNLGKKAGDCGTPDSNGSFSAISSVSTSQDI